MGLGTCQLVIQVAQASLNVVQAVMLAYIATRSRRVRRSDRYPARWEQDRKGQWFWTGGSGIVR